MKVEVFDDMKGSIAHIIAGGLTYFIPAVFVVFMLYEYVEHISLRGKEKEANYLGDIMEYSVGIMTMTILVGILGWVGAIIFAGFVVGLAYCMREWYEEVNKNE